MDSERRRVRKRRCIFTPTTSPQTKRASLQSTPNKFTAGSKKRLLHAIEHSNYDAAIRHILAEKSAAREALIRCVTKEICNEFTEYSKENYGLFSKEFDLESLESFSWEDLERECAQHMPVMVAILKSILPHASAIAKGRTKGPAHERRSMTPEEGSSLLSARLGMVLSILMFTRSPLKNKFIQSALGVELWRQGSTLKVFEALNFLGISQSVKAARAHVDNLGKYHNMQLDEWRKTVQASVSNEEPQSTEPSRGYSFTTGTVQVKTYAKRYGERKGKKRLWLGMCLATENRVPTVRSYDESTPVLARALSPYAFMPSPEDFETLRYRMEFIVSRILTNHLPCLTDSVKSPDHLPHEHSMEMKEASNVVTVGAVEADPSSAEGPVTVMVSLQDHIPKDPNGDFITILSSGDNLTVEQMRMAKRAAINELSPEGRLEGLQECPPESHKEALLVQDAMDEFLKHRSMVSRGTLYNLMVHFGRKTSRRKAREDFQHAWDMFEFTTVGYVLLLALKLCSITHLEDVPTNFPRDKGKKEKAAWVKGLAKEIVDTCWSPVSSEDIKQAADAFVKYQEGKEDQRDSHPFCYCNSEKEDSMVQCCNSLCIQEWFHVSCIKGEKPTEDEEWYCSSNCKKSLGYIYCICHKKITGAAMIQCSLEKNCRRYEWYHMKCVGGIQGDLPDKWYCCEDCELGAEDDDGVVNHSKAILWEGLNLLARRDAVREGDGPAMMIHWKHDMMNFWSKKHFEYFESGCHMLAGASGTLGERLKQDIIWNRVANIHGGEGNNIGLDLLVQSVNSEFKEMVRRCHGRYIDQQLNRLAEMSGGVGRKLERLFAEAQLDGQPSHGFHSRGSWFENDVKNMVMEFKSDGLFDYCPVRSHAGFEDYKVNRKLRCPRKMGIRIAKHTYEIDVWKQLSTDVRECTPVEQCPM